MRLAATFLARLLFFGLLLPSFDRRPMALRRIGCATTIKRLLSAGSAQNHLYHQRHREPAHAAPQNRKEPGTLPQRRSRHQAVVPGLAQYRQRLEDAATNMEGGGQSIGHHVRRTIHGRIKLMP